MSRKVKCVKFGMEAEGLPVPPYPGELGQRILRMCPRRRGADGWNTRKCW